jgi:MOSC domain-containing protein YiiM
MALIRETRVDGLFAGRVALLENDSRSSAIAKSAVSGRLALTPTGLVGDEQADRRVHGDEGKALHLLPAEHLVRLQSAFPEARHLYPGGLGENISTAGQTECDVCIGDIFRIGTAWIQVSQPRRPCWKIDHRTGCDGMAAYIFLHGIAGWYFRVLEAGTIAVDDVMTHSERPVGAPTLMAFWNLTRNERYPAEALEQLATAPGLEPDWRTRLQERAAYLRRNPIAVAE